MAKKSCWSCDGKNVIRWGVQSGKQRFKCKDCNLLFTRKNVGVRDANQFIWFEKWIIERQVYKYLVRDSSMSQSKLQRLFKHYLSQAPEVVIKSKKQAHILIDGSYFPNELCLILYYDHDIRYVQLFRHTKSEKQKEIIEDLKNLKKLQVDIFSVTCDGHNSILKSVRKIYPETIIQRCLVHIKRQAKNYLSNAPKAQPGKELLAISKHITKIKTMEQSDVWLMRFHMWHQQYETYVKEKTFNPETNRSWYTHKNLHAAYALILNAIPHMFAYLDYPEIPNTTNRLENYFRHLKEKLGLHTGLRYEAKRNFIKWYLHFKNKNRY